MKRSAGLIALPIAIGIVLAIGLLSSCGNTRALQYLQGQFDTAKLSQVQYSEPVIQKNDLLSITIYSDDPTGRASAFYNLPVQSTLSNTGSTSAPSIISASSGSTYLVDEVGNLQLPGLGKITAAGLTKGQLDSLLVSKLKDKLQNPYTIIRLVSYKITLIGEVTKPGQFTIPNERVSLLEAIALAGDLTVYARRDNVMILREINGQRTFARLDLKKPEILNSPYFYLQPNDVVIVDLNKNKAAANDQLVLRNISLAISLVSALAILITLSRTK